MKIKYINLDHICDWKRKLVDIFELLVGDTTEVEDISKIETSELYKYFPFPKYIYSEIDEDHDGKELEDGIKNTSVEVDASEIKPDMDMFMTFLQDNIAEILGGAKQLIPNVIEKINDRIRENEYRYVVYSSYKFKARSSVMIFLGANIFEGDIKFINNQTDLLDGEVITKEELNNL